MAPWQRVVREGNKPTLCEARIVERNCNHKGGKNNTSLNVTTKRNTGEPFNMKASAEIRPGPNLGSKGLASPLEASLASS